MTLNQTRHLENSKSKQYQITLHDSHFPTIKQEICFSKNCRYLFTKILCLIKNN